MSWVKRVRQFHWYWIEMWIIIVLLWISCSCSLFSYHAAQNATYFRRKILFSSIFIEKKMFFLSAEQFSLIYAQIFLLFRSHCETCERAARASFFNPQRNAVFESSAQHPWSSQFSHCASLSFIKLVNRKYKKHYKI